VVNAMVFSEADMGAKPGRAILFASYEERSTKVASVLATAGYDGHSYVLYCHDLGCDQTRHNAEAIVSMLPGRSELVRVSYHDPAAVIGVARSLDVGEDDLVDVSCFNRGNLFPFLWAASEGGKRDVECMCAYCAPEHYGTWLSRDYERPANIIGYGGSFGFSSDRLLVCLVGYESERALEVIRACEPSRVILGVGTIPTRDEFLDRNRQAVREVLGSAMYEVVELNVADPESCRVELDRIANETSAGAAVGFAPFSTKLSCLSVWAVWMQHPEVRVWNAQPRAYNILDYSRGSAEPRFFRVQARAAS